jgi:hypothetical protein
MFSSDLICICTTAVATATTIGQSTMRMIRIDDEEESEQYNIGHFILYCTVLYFIILM